ncbi:thioredoxin family protein [Deinococcus sp.]|uniref:thioredoxin family protein n=1 Tax=Deinococcus sp. TaxID=47478 RepID=UPI003B5A80FF
MNKNLTAALILTAAAAGTAALAAAKTDTKPGAMMAESGYQVYTKAAFDAAVSEKRVLFFHATWCPNCKQADADINANLKDLPKDIVIFKTDYDKEVALKKQYGITYQHTFVLVDDKGTAIRKWAGGGLKQIVANAEKASAGQ